MCAPSKNAQSDRSGVHSPCWTTEQTRGDGGWIDPLANRVGVSPRYLKKNLIWEERGETLDHTRGTGFWFLQPGPASLAVSAADPKTRPHISRRKEVLVPL